MPNNNYLPPHIHKFSGQIIMSNKSRENGQNKIYEEMHR